MNTFGERLREQRKQARQSQAALATALGIAQAYVSALEQRETAPREDVLRRLSNHFGVHMTYWLGESDIVTGIEPYHAERWIDERQYETVTTDEDALITTSLQRRAQEAALDEW